MLLEIIFVKPNGKNYCYQNLLLQIKKTYNKLLSNTLNVKRNVKLISQQHVAIYIFAQNL